jgi:hypothetical protein
VTKSLGIWERVSYRWKGLENTFPTVYHALQKTKITVTKRIRENYSHLVTADHADQRTIVDFGYIFLGIVFY